MLKDGIEKIEEMASAKIFEVGDKTFSDKELYPVIFKHDKEPKPDVLQVHTLSGLIDYINAEMDISKETHIHVVGPNCVNVYGEFEPEFGRRKHYLQSKISDSGFEFDEYHDQETFVISLQSSFEETKDRAAVLAQVGNVKDESRLQSEDDGISQNATVKTGVGTLADEKLKNPVKLAPFNSFPEIKQVECQYVLRMQKSPRGGVEFALFEAEGKRWELEAIHRIRDFLKDNLSKDISIIA